MKRILVLLALAALLVTPSLAPAADQIGVYVAPRLVYGHTLMDGVNANLWDGYANNKLSVGKQTDSALSGALAVGYDFSKQLQIPIRAELEYSLFSNVTGKGAAYFAGIDMNLRIKQRIQSLFMNVYHDINTGTALTPYVGAGFGMAFIGAEGSGYSGAMQYSASAGSYTLTSFAWNLGAGAGYRLTDNIGVDLGYRFASLGKAKTKANQGFLETNGETEDIYMHQVMLGMRVTF